MKKYIRKADIVLLIVLLAIGIASSVYLASSRTGGDTVIISQNGEMYGKYSLMEDNKIVIEDGDEKNVITIKGGKVSMTEASCHNQVCVHHSPISYSGESIICLPNKVVVKIEGGGGYDAVSK